MQRGRLAACWGVALWVLYLALCFLAKVSFDSTKHLSDASIKKRQLERQKLQELEQQREEQKRREKEAEERQRAEERWATRTHRAHLGSRCPPLTRVCACVSPCALRASCVRVCITCVPRCVSMCTSMCAYVCPCVLVCTAAGNWARSVCAWSRPQAQSQQGLDLGGPLRACPHVGPPHPMRPGCRASPCGCSCVDRTGGRADGGA